MRLSVFLISGIMVCGLGVQIHAQAPKGRQAIVRAEAETRTVDCGGGDAEVGGNRNTLSFRGACRDLMLRGDANTVDIELAPGARIDIEGNRNRLRYSVVGGGAAPSVRISGSDTDLAPAGNSPAPAPVPQPAHLSGDNQRLDVDCTGRDVDIQGNRSTYTLRGGCRSITAHGDGNTLRAELEPGARVEIEGNGTTLTYGVSGSGAEPQVVVRGTDSHVVRTGAIAAAPPPLPAPAPAPAAPPPPSAPAVPASPPPAPTARGVPQLMHDLDGKVVERGTEMTFPVATLFDGSSDKLRDDADARLSAIASLAAQIHPTGLRINISDPANAELATRRAQTLRAWFANAGVILPMSANGAMGGAAETTVLLAR